MLFKKRDYFPNNKTRIFKDKKIIIKIIIVLEIFINYIKYLKICPIWYLIIQQNFFKWNKKKN